MKKMKGKMKNEDWADASDPNTVDEMMRIANIKKIEVSDESEIPEPFRSMKPVEVTRMVGYPVKTYWYEVKGKQIGVVVRPKTTGD